MARVEEAGLATVREELSGLHRQHGGAVVARVGHDLFDPEEVGGSRGRGHEVLGLLVVLEGAAVVVLRLAGQALGERVPVQLGQVLAEGGDLVVEHPSGHPPAVQGHQLGLALAPASPRDPRHGRSVDQCSRTTDL